MTERFDGGCIEACEAFGTTVQCCGSCHADDEGDELREVMRDGRWFLVCCAVRQACEELPASHVPPEAAPIDGEA